MFIIYIYIYKPVQFGLQQQENLKNKDTLGILIASIIYEKIYLSISISTSIIYIFISIKNQCSFDSNSGKIERTKIFWV